MLIGVNLAKLVLDNQGPCLIFLPSYHTPPQHVEILACTFLTRDGGSHKHPNPRWSDSGSCLDVPGPDIVALTFLPLAQSYPLDLAQKMPWIFQTAPTGLFEKNIEKLPLHAVTVSFSKGRRLL